ncbi:TRAP transporter TatT component family protein [Geopsychrobacter electrodiphilus]|uniref:TRAP transporter TatT component family protein n=1 Tax=Geopsychrobacter electrodiphilus TaxID=225196 RepID=UPI00037CC4EA|nr:TRAP transporter TatT component family protein [Geopsychrobacter electrodiphilus]
MHYLLVLMVLLLSGCGLSSMPQHMAQATLDQTDPETVAAAAPAYLLLFDSLIDADPQDVDYLRDAAGLYALFGDVLITDKVRSKRLSERSFAYANRAICNEEHELCGLNALPFDPFVAKMKTFAELAPALRLVYLQSWLVYLKHHADDWNELARLPQLEALVGYLLHHEEGAESPQLHLYLAILQTLRPAMYGGKPEEGRLNFERAMKLAPDDLSIKVAFARFYARGVYDKELHDRLLNEVLTADPVKPGFTLLNTLAQRDARELLASGPDFF